MCLGILAILLSVGTCIPVDFDALIKHAEAYNGKCVNVIGVAEIDGVSFTVWQPPKRNLRFRITVDQEAGKSYDRLNNNWVKVSGVVHKDKEGIFACKLSLTEVEVVSRPPVQDPRTYGVFRNDGPNQIWLEISNKTGNEHIQMTLLPGDTNKVVVGEGFARIYATSDFSKKVSECIIPNSESAGDRFDQATRSFNFRINHGKVRLIRSVRRGQS